MQLIKNIASYFGWSMLLSIMTISGLAFAQLDNTDNPFTNPNNPGSAEKIAVIGLDDATTTEGGQGDSLINVIRGAVNWVLGIMGLIALLVLLRGGFQMVTAAGDEDKYGNGFKILKQAAAGLVMIGVAWFIVSIIFFVINLVTVEGAQDGAGTDE